MRECRFQVSVMLRKSFQIIFAEIFNVLFLIVIIKKLNIHTGI